MATIITFVSGKEGVGKTNIVANLAISLAARNTNVCLFDASSGGDNIKTLMGLPTGFTIENVLSAEKTIDEITYKTSSGVSIISAAVVKKYSELSSQYLTVFNSSFKILDNKFDFILIDTVAAVDTSEFDFIVLPHCRVIIITSEPRSLTKSFDLLRTLIMKEKQASFFIWVNRVKDYQTSLDVFDQFQKAVKTYLNINVYYLGYLTEDEHLNHALLQQIPVVISYPNSAISCGFSAMADVIKRRFENDKIPFLFTGANKINTQQKKNIRGLIGKKVLENNRLVDIYNFLERQQLSESKLKEFILTLENVYEKKYKKSIRETTSIIAVIFAEGNVGNIKHLYHSIARNYELQFGTKINSGIQALLKSEEFSRKKFDITIKKVLKIYQKRFNEKYFE